MNTVQADIGRYRQLWGELMPHIGTPSQGQFLLWTTFHPSRFILRGFAWAAAKANTRAKRGEVMTLDDVSRYATCVMVNEARDNRRHDASNSSKTAHSHRADYRSERGNERTFDSIS